MPLRPPAGFRSAFYDPLKVTKQEWVKTGYNSWFFNQETCSFDPPTPYPNDNKIYTWDEPSFSWIEVTP